MRREPRTWLSPPPSPPHQPRTPQTSIVIMRLVSLLRHLGHDHDRPTEGRARRRFAKGAIWHILSALPEQQQTHIHAILATAPLAGTRPPPQGARSLSAWLAWAGGGFVAGHRSVRRRGEQHREVLHHLVH